MSKRITTVKELETITSQLVNDVPGLADSFPNFQQLNEEWLHYRKRCSYYVFGTIKSGKTTLVNAILGQDLLPRGSGVKTFSRARVVHSSETFGRLTFYSAAQLNRNMAHDFRMLGTDPTIPADVFSREGRESLEQQFASFKKQASEDGRLARLQDPEHRYSLINLAFTRIERTLFALSLLEQHTDHDSLVTIQRDRSLTYQKGELAAFYRWLDVAAFAALIEDVEVGCPFPDYLPKDIELVDCQGSDSLNPLDFASLDEVIHKTDRILYVINSRLGLRDADARLLAHLRERSALEKLTIVVNVEAYQPMDRPESNRLLGRIAEDLNQATQSTEQAPEILTVNSLLALQKGSEEAARIQKQWAKQGVRHVLEEHEENFTKLCETILQEPFARDQNLHLALPSLIAHAAKVAEALLAHDESLWGTSGSTKAGDTELEAFRRILKPEGEALKKEINTLAWEAFDKHAAWHQHLEDFFRQKEALLADRKPSKELGKLEQHGPILVDAIEAFHKRWEALEQELQQELVAPLSAKVKSTVLTHLIPIHKMMQSVFDQEVLALMGPWAVDNEPFLNQMNLEFDHLLSREVSPHILQPIVLPSPVVGSLTASFYAQKWFQAIRAKLDQGTTNKTDKRATRLWTQTIAALMRHAKQDVPFTLSSCRENLKFQYYFKVVDKVLDKIYETLSTNIERQSQNLSRIQTARSQLLTAQERSHITLYLARLRGTAPEVGSIQSDNHSKNAGPSL